MNFIGRLCRVAVDEVLVVRHRSGTDVRRCRQLVVQQHPRLAVADLEQVVGLAEQQVLVVEGLDRPVVVEERVRPAPVVGVEDPAVGDVRDRVTVAVDVDVVVRILRPRVKVRAAVGFRERRSVGDEGDGVLRVRARERIDVGVVHRRHARDERCLPVARRDGVRHQRQCRGGQCRAGAMNANPAAGARAVVKPFSIPLPGLGVPQSAVSDAARNESRGLKKTKMTVVKSGCKGQW